MVCSGEYRLLTSLTWPHFFHRTAQILTSNLTQFSGARSVEEKIISATESLVIQTQSEPFNDGWLVLDAFSFADGVVRHPLNEIEY